jgi:hypothetical protein
VLRWSPGSQSPKTPKKLYPLSKNLFPISRLNFSYLSLGWREVGHAVEVAADQPITVRWATEAGVYSAFDFFSKTKWRAKERHSLDVFET